MPRIGVGNRVLSGEELAKELKDPGAAPVTVVGAVKKAADGSEVLFTQDAGGGVWAEVPVKMIESAEVLGRVAIGGEACLLVRLDLKGPTQGEGAVLARLFSLQEAKSREGTLPLRGVDGTLPLRPPGNGSLPLLDGVDGTLPLRLIELAIQLMGRRVGNG